MQGVVARVGQLAFLLGLTGWGSNAVAALKLGASLEFGSTFASEDAGTFAAFSPIARLGLGLPLGFDLRLTVPAVVGNFSNAGALAAIGNPQLTVSAPIHIDEVRVEARVSGTAPVARPHGDSSHTDDFWRITRGAAAAARGLYDAQLWVESTGAVLGGGSVRLDSGPVYSAIHFDVGVLYGAGARLLAQGAVEGGGRVTEWLELGVKLQVVGLTESSAGPRLICIARTPEECGEQRGAFDAFPQLYIHGRRALVEDVLVVSLVPSARFILEPVELGLGLALNLSDLVAVGAGGGVGAGLLLSIALSPD